MKIVSWNIKCGHYPEEIVDFLNKLQADIYLLTEVDRGNRRTQMIDMFAIMQDKLGLPGRFALEFEEHYSIWRSLIPISGQGGGVHGNAVFSKYAIENYREIKLPTNENLSWNGSTLFPELFDPRTGSRIAQVFDVRLNDRPVSIVNTHLECWRSNFQHRIEQLEAVVQHIKDQAAVLAGDLNPMGGVLSTWIGRSITNWEVPAFRKFFDTHGLSDPFSDRDHTLFNWGTRSKFDWVCVSPHLKVLGTENIKTRLSDHNCLVVEVEA